ncbi:hypothetical protein [Bacillus thuringiensis]|uniref:hypothetical protein n=1 Tax=Bacillus thuringiensis TaxID=1428 RepID=UPI0011A3A14B|nr:hypothetical protein [Bacillus thuringiensis]
MIECNGLLWVLKRRDDDFVSGWVGEEGLVWRIIIEVGDDLRFLLGMLWLGNGLLEKREGMMRRFVLLVVLVGFIERKEGL